MTFQRQINYFIEGLGLAVDELGYQGTHVFNFGLCLFYSEKINDVIMPG